MKFIKTPVKGMCDMLPSDMRLREHVLGMIKETYGRYGFMQIETPVMEHIENLTSKQGGDNEKLIFKVMKRGAELQRAIDKGDGEYANNEIGTIEPIAELAAVCKKHGVLFHTDAVQAVSKIPICLKDTKINMLSFSGHKIHAPKGIGVLYVRRGTRFVPFMKGGHQERGRRAGTENVPYIVGLGVACELAGQHISEVNTRIRKLRDRLQEGILKSIPECFVTGDPQNRTANTLNVAFKFVEG